MTAFNHHHLATALLATTVLSGAPAYAQSTLDQTREFSVQAGSLEDVLLSVAEQSRIQLLYPSDLLPPSRTAGIVGSMSVRQAMERVLVGTGLQWRESRPGVIVITRAERVRTQNGPDAVTVEAVTVTGTLLPGSGGPASPVVMLSRSDMDRAGYSDVADALNALPQNQGGVGTPASMLTGADPMGVNVGLANGVNLRGLGTDATLILVNGRRMAGSGLQGDFSDVSALPAAAVERVDVLLDGASALYGSDAVGGVVNVILRRGFDGQETRARVSGFDGGHDWSLAHTLGRRWSSGSALLSYETRRSAALNADDRAYTRTGDLRPFGGSDRRQFYAAPGNIMGINAAGTGYEALWAIRPQADGTAAFAAGETNLAFRQAGVDILPEQEVHSGYARLDLDPAPWLRLSADFRLNDRSFVYRSLSPAGIATVTAANPYFQSPTGATSHQVAYNFLDEAGPSWARGGSVT